MVFAIKFIIVTIAMFLADVCWTMYFVEVEKRKSISAGLWGSAILLFGSVVTINYVGEGWGLCNDGKNIIMSDGSERIYFRNPNTFEITKTIEIYDNIGPKINLNELEFLDGKIYANVWQENYILVIDPILGKVEKVIDCSNVVSLARGQGEVLNGIAYNKNTKKLYLTGKNWSKIAEVTLTKK